MVTISDREKCMYIWGSSPQIDDDVIMSYRARGYAIVRLSNGTGNIKDCIKAVVKSKVAP